MSDTFDPPAGFTEVAKTLESRGYEAWAVGGAVRDQILGQSRADWDLATSAGPQEVRAVFPRTVPLGIEHGTVGVIASDEEMYEVTTFRRDVETDGRHAVVEFATTIDEDLARRDFTINALAWRPETDELRDPFEGREDLERRVLRAVEEPSRRFAEDHLRVLRGLRFAGRLRMEIEDATRRALREAVPRIEDLSAERVREELMKVLADEEPSGGLRLYAEFGALEPWHAELAEVAKADPRWELHLGAVDALSPARPGLRLARLLVPVAEEGEDRAERGGALMERLKFSRARTERVKHLLLHYRPLPGPTVSDAAIREWLSEVGAAHVRDLFRLHIAGARASGAGDVGEGERARYLIFLWRRAHEQLLERPPLTISDLAIDGSDLLTLGVEEGPAVGLLLDELHAVALEDPESNDRKSLLARARELMAMGHLDSLTGARDD